MDVFIKTVNYFVIIVFVNILDSSHIFITARF